MIEVSYAALPVYKPYSTSCEMDQRDMGSLLIVNASWTPENC